MKPPHQDSNPIGLLVAGGRGSRLGGTLAKPLVPVAGRPLIDRNLERLRRAGVRRVYVSLGPKADRIRAHLEGLAACEVELRWLLEDEPRGTLGSLSDLASLGATVVAVNSDLFTSLDLAPLLAQHRAERAALTLAVHDECHRLEFGEVLFDEAGGVRGYAEKPEKRYPLCSGVYIVAPELLGRVPDRGRFGAPQLVATALDARLPVAAHRHGAAWLDINAPDTLAAAERLAADHPELDFC